MWPFTAGRSASRRRILFRVAAAGVLLGASGALLLAAYLSRDQPFASSLSINLATEIFGIGVTVAVVEWLFERSRLQERGRQLAWNVLHQLERAVWVWRGGPRRMGTDQLMGILTDSQSQSTLTPFSRSLLVSLATTSQQLAQRETAATDSIRGLQETLHDLTSLHRLEESAASSTIAMTSEVLAAAVRSLAAMLDQPTGAIPGGLVRDQDVSIAAQQARAQSLTELAEM